VRPLSKAVFNGAFVLEALVAIAQLDRFYGGQLCELTGCEGSYASALIKKLLDADLIEALRREEGQSRKYFRRRPSPLWHLAIEWADSIVNPKETGVARLSTRK